MTKKKPKPVTQEIDSGHSKIWLSPEMQTEWEKLAQELYFWLKERFDKPVEAFAFLHFTSQYLEKQHGFTYTGTERVEEHQT